MIHLVYHHDSHRCSAPHSIGNHLAAGLRAAGHEVRQYGAGHCGRFCRWEAGEPEPAQGDVLICQGFDRGEVSDAICDDPRWRKRIYITHWNGLDWRIDGIQRNIERLDHTILLCGPYWAERMPSAWLNLRDKWTTADLAVDQADFPRAKPSFNPPGQRALVYIGSCMRGFKGIEWLVELAHWVPRMKIAHIGPGIIAGIDNYDYANFQAPGVLDGLRAFDFLIAPGENDANPTVVLEAASWGLIPLVRPTCGWLEEMGGPCVNLPGDHSRAAAILQWAQYVDESELLALQRRNWALLDNYGWDRFVDTVLEVIA